MSMNSKKSAPRRIDFENAVNQDKPNKVVISPILGKSSPRSNSKRKIDFFSSSPTKTARNDVAAFVTPLKEGTPNVDCVVAETSEDKIYVPTHVYKNIEYKRRGEATCSLDERIKKTFALVEEYYVLPKDLETNRRYGPKSGLSFEEHAIRAYVQNMLEAKIEGSSIQICTACANTGHLRNDCPALV